MKTMPPPPDRVPMHQVEELAEWLVPGSGFGLLTNAINLGELNVFAVCAPPATGVTFTETHDGVDVAPEWSDRWTDGPLAPTQVAWARIAANFPHSGWERWYDHMVKVDQYELATLIERVARMVPTANKGSRWTACDVFAWISGNDPTPASDQSPFPPNFDASTWQFARKGVPWRALIWRIERAAGSWRNLPGNDAPAARKVFDTLHGALWPQIDRCKVYIERADGWHDAPSAAFAGAIFDTAATALDLASGARLVFDADSVRQRWPVKATHQPRGGRPRQIDHERVRAMARAELANNPDISMTKAASVIASELQRDARGIRKIIAPEWGDK